MNQMVKFFPVILIINVFLCDINIHADENESMVKYPNSFSIIDMWFSYFQAPIAIKSTELKAQINMNQITPYLFYNVNLDYDFSKNKWQAIIDTYKSINITINYILSKTNEIVYTANIIGIAEVGGISSEQLYKQDKGKYKVIVTVVEKVCSNDASTFQIVTFKALVELKAEVQKIEIKSWEKVPPKSRNPIIPSEQKSKKITNKIKGPFMAII